VNNQWLEALERRRLFAVLFADEFNGTTIGSAWNSATAVWGVQTPGGELESYQGANVTISNGALDLTAKKDSSGNWTSGEVHTSGGWTYGNSTAPGFAFLYGYAEASIKMPAAIANDAGLWPAFWMMPIPNGPGNLRDNGEIDATENVPDGPLNDLDSVHLHYSGGTAGHDFHTGIDLSKAFHRYGVDWQQNSISWYFDGSLVLTYTGATPAVPEYLIFNLAVGDSSSWPGAPNAQTANPAVMAVSWVHVTSTRAEAFDGTPTQPPLLGDTNLDGTVNAVDLAILAANLGKTSGATWAQGDFDNNGTVNVADLGDLAGNWGKSATGVVTTQTFADAWAQVQLGGGTIDDQTKRHHRK
jgi:beta-glucanase (GH16 family)